MFSVTVLMNENFLFYVFCDIIEDMKDTIVNTQNKQKIEEFAKKHGLSLLVLFGSQATGKTHKKSDIDIAFISSKKLSLREVANLAFEATSILQDGPVDLVDVRNTSPLLLREIVQSGKILYEKESSTFILLKIYAHKLVMEAKPLLKLRRDSLNNFLQR
jgi:uncharacterized protein